MIIDEWFAGKRIRLDESKNNTTNRARRNNTNTFSNSWNPIMNRVLTIKTTIALSSYFCCGCKTYTRRCINQIRQRLNHLSGGKNRISSWKWLMRFAWNVSFIWRAKYYEKPQTSNPYVCACIDEYNVLCINTHTNTQTHQHLESRNFQSSDSFDWLHFRFLEWSNSMKMKFYV